MTEHPNRVCASTCTRLGADAACKPCGNTPGRVLRVRLSDHGTDRSYATSEAISRAGIPQYGFDYPYPCRNLCQRVTYPVGTDDTLVDTVAAKLDRLGVLMSDGPYVPPLTHYDGEIVGQEALF